MPEQLWILAFQLQIILFHCVTNAVASADYRFVMVDIGAYGSSNDSGVLNHTALFKCLKKKLGIPPSK